MLLRLKIISIKFIKLIRIKKLRNYSASKLDKTIPNCVINYISMNIDYRSVLKSQKLLSDSMSSEILSEITLLN